jgi:hypothetical protein
MTDGLKLAAEYRQHAKALLAAAKFEQHAKSSIMLKRIARDYEQMALALDGVHDTNKAVGKV